MEYNKFKEYLKYIKDFLDDQKKLDNVINVISPGSFERCEFGDNFLDGFIKLLSDSIGDTNDFLYWFIIENDFGNKKLTVTLNDIPYVIDDDVTFWIYLNKFNNVK